MVKKFSPLLFLILVSCKSSVPAFTLFHTTVYNYSIPVTLSDQIIRLHAFKNDERIVSCSILTDSANYIVKNDLDKYNQKIWIAHFNSKVTFFKITTRLVIDSVKLSASNSKYSLLEYPDLPGSFLETDIFDTAMYTFLKRHPLNEKADENELLQACKTIYQQFAYTERYEPGVYTCAELLESGEGSCRDLTWFLVQYLRSQHIPARVVSGYLIDPDKKTADFHAWAEAKSNNGRWVGMDPTSGLFITAFHIPLSIGKNYNEITPVEGFTDSCGVKLDYELKLIKE